MLSTFLISLREGLEAALIIGILVAYLVRSARTNALKYLWAGVATAGILALLFGGLLTYTSLNLSVRGEQLFAGTTSLAAVVLVTAMVFWMKRSARSIAGELHGKVDTALTMGNFALAAVAFLSVGREGLETSLFLYADFKTVNHDTAPLAGLLLGLASAVILGVLLYKRSIKINLSKFFRVTGLALLVVAAGVLIHGIGELQNRGSIPGSHSFAWNFSGGSGILITVLDGTFGIANAMTVLQLSIYILYLAFTLTWFLKALPLSAPTPLESKTTSQANA